MRKKSFAATITIIFCAIFVSVVGATFSTYMLRKNIVKIENPKIITVQGISVFDEENKKISVIKLNDMKLGLKPATGEEDSESEIPSTVTSSMGTEGYYAKFKVTSENEFQIFIENIKIETRQNKNKVQKERENIKVALEGIKNTTTNLVNSEVLLYSNSGGCDKKEFTLLIWLTAKAGDDLKGAKISFDVIFK